jgi:hypothetical protein
MAQRRSSPGRGDDRSDLDDVKALAAKARSETGGPVLKPNPGELSGVRPRRDSVVGMRLTPPPRPTAGGDLPNWLWGVLGCLSVLLVGFAGLFFLGRSGKLGPLLSNVASLVGGAPPAASPAPASTPPLVAVAPAIEPEAPPPAEHAVGHSHEHGHAHGAAPAAPADRAQPLAPAPAAPVAEGEPAAAPTVPPADDTGDDSAKRAARPLKAKAARGEAPAGDDDNGAAPAPKAAAAAAAPKAADDSDEDSLPGQDDVERALDALAPRVRGCFVKYQIKGTARVRLVATPAGKAESVNVTGDFEDTPTGNCVESILSEAKLPTFKGPPLKLSQSYQLR